MSFIIVTIVNGEVFFISQAKTLRGAHRSAKYNETLMALAKGDGVKTIIMSVDELLKWNARGQDELERMAAL